MDELEAVKSGLGLTIEGNKETGRRNFIKQSMKALTSLAALSTGMSLFSSCNKVTQNKNLLTIETSVTKAYLLKANQGYLLIDTGYSEQYDNFLQILKSHGIGRKEISHVLLTHHHDDHSGFASRLIEDSGAQLIVHEKALPYITKGVSSDREYPLNNCTYAMFSIFALFKQNTDHSYPKIMPRNKDVIIQGTESDYLESIGIEGKILYTPGHTDDSISVVLNDGNTFVGDAAMDLLNVCLCDRRPIYYNNYDQIFTSWEGLLKKGTQTIYPAHGNPFSARELVASAISNRKR